MGGEGDGALSRKYMYAVKLTSEVDILHLVQGEPGPINILKKKWGWANWNGVQQPVCGLYKHLVDLEMLVSQKRQTKQISLKIEGDSKIGGGVCDAA